MISIRERLLLKDDSDKFNRRDICLEVRRFKCLVTPKKGWARILKKAKIKDLHLHDLRRTLGSYMAMSGVSLSVIGNALNHKDISTTRKVYAQSAREAERAARLQAHKRIFAKTQPSNVFEIEKKENIEF